MPRETLGQRLTTLRKKEGWSQDYVATQLGIKQQGYSRYENDDITAIPLSRLTQLSLLFNVPVEEFMTLALAEKAPSLMREPCELTPEEVPHAP